MTPPQDINGEKKSVTVLITTYNRANLLPYVFSLFRIKLTKILKS